MELYVLNSEFQKLHVIDEFESLIWTERYSSGGEAIVAVAEGSSSAALLTEGTRLKLPDSDEVMIIDTTLVENGVHKATGGTLVTFLNNRILRVFSAPEERYWNTGRNSGATIWQMVWYMCANNPPKTSDESGAGGIFGFDVVPELIPNLDMGDMYTIPYDEVTLADTLPLQVPFGPLYDAIMVVSNAAPIGFKLYLEGASDSDYSLKFKTYKGRDLTSNQSTYPLVRFSRSTDTLNNVKDLRSMTGYKNVCYAYSPNITEDLGLGIAPGVAYATPADEFSVGFDRRTMLIMPEEVTQEAVFNDATVRMNWLTSLATTALANNNFIRVIDGDLVPQEGFRFKVNYDLGDIIELDSGDGFLQKARVTEYIRTQDREGEKAYPTIEVIT